MIERLPYLNELFVLLCLSEETAAIVTEVLKMLTGALAYQTLLYLIRLGRWCCTGSPLEALDSAVLLALEGAAWHQNKGHITTGSVCAWENNNGLSVQMDGADITAALTPKGVRHVRSLLAQKKAEYERQVAKQKQQQAESQKQRILAELAKKV